MILINSKHNNNNLIKSNNQLDKQEEKEKLGLFKEDLKIQI